MTNRKTEWSQPDGPDLPADALNALFAEARRVPQETPTVSSDLMARVLADALAQQSDAAAKNARLPEPRWQGVRATLGGWLGLGGLVAAGITGLAIGLVQPAALDPSITAGLSVLGEESADALVFDPLDTFDVSLFMEEPGL